MIPSHHQTVRRLAQVLGRLTLPSGSLHLGPLEPTSRHHFQRSKVPLYFGFGAALLLGATALAQSPTPPATPYINRNVIVLDPAHGGQDNGASLNGQPEKNITLSLAASLKSLLTAEGFTVVSTRETDLPATSPLLTTDQRAGIANHLHPAACIVLHATAIGSGVHLATSTLTPSGLAYNPNFPLAWESAQSPYLPQSQRLANDLGLSLLRAKLPVLLARAAIRPLENLTCPAIAIEIAPLALSGQKSLPPTDATYQQRVANTLAAAILLWRDTTLPAPAPRPAPKPTPTTGATP